MANEQLTKEQRIELFEETRVVSRAGYFAPRDPRYRSGYGPRVTLPFTPAQLREAIYISKEEAHRLSQQEKPEKPCVLNRDRIWLFNRDSGCSVDYPLASIQKAYDIPTEGRILVLNFGNPTHPGGQAAKGFAAQEEDLCIRTTLYASLSGKAASPYYQNHQKNRSPLASDAMLISPNVVLLRPNSYSYQLMRETTVFSALTCTAPSAVQRELSDEAYEALLLQRMLAMLHAAAHYGYRKLVLGAWGCGIYGNDPTQIARLFIKAFEEVRHDGKDFNELFDFAAFCVLDNSREKKTYRAFKHVLYPRTEEPSAKTASQTRRPDAEREPYLDKIRGSLIGGAAGDALGYPVEFMSWAEIRTRYGENGIQEYTPDPKTGAAIFSDDTQMTLYTANGLLYGETRGSLRGIMGPPASYIQGAYHDWYHAQRGRITEKTGEFCWLNDRPEMHASRAPGNTCMSALGYGETGSVAHPCNNSKGCGGVMRVAPIGLYYPSRSAEARLWADKVGAEAAAITHGHPLGYIPAAMMTHIINIGIYGNCSRGDTFLDAVEDSLTAMRELFPEQPNALTVMEKLTRMAITLAEAGGDDETNIRALGEGWVADEALAIALYCCLRYPKDFSRAIIAAVNHSGDSDSTGSITGNLLGAWLGLEAIEEKWLNRLEMRAVIQETADDLCYGCQMTEYGNFRDTIWECKYVYGRYPETEGEAKELISDAMD